jgi:hypothetical protein
LERAEPRVVHGDPLEAAAHDRDRRQRSCADERRQFGGAPLDETGGHIDPVCRDGWSRGGNAFRPHARLLPTPVSA